VISEALRVTLAVIDAFVEIGVRYHLGGSFASSIHGVPRQTRDVDLVADLRTEHVDALVRLLADAFYIDGGMIAEAISRHSSFNLVHFESGFKVDVFVLGEGPFDQAEFERSAPTRLVQEPPRDVFVKSWRPLAWNASRASSQCQARNSGGDVRSSWFRTMGSTRSNRGDRSSSCRCRLRHGRAAGLQRWWKSLLVRPACR